MLASKLLSACGGEETLFSDDVFSAYLRTGTGADVTVTTGIDMTKGYMLWSKGRSGATDHAIYDSARGVTFDLVSNSTAAQTTQATGLKAVSSTGHTVGSLAKMNTSAATYVDFVFRRAPKFFDCGTYTGNGSPQNINHSLGVVPGMIIIKRTDSTSNWLVWHRGTGNTNSAVSGISLNATNAALYSSEPQTPHTATTFNTNYIADHSSGYAIVNGATYVWYAFAHDPSADGIIQCGSFTSAPGIESVNLGWEPQYLLYKRANDTSNWAVADSMRGVPTGSASKLLNANLSSAEADGSNITFKATGFEMDIGSTGDVWIYLAIRRPNKPPTTGTQVYNAIARTGTGAAATVTGVGFAPDLFLTKKRDAGTPVFPFDKLRGTGYLNMSNTDAETPYTQAVTAYLNDGVAVGTDGDANGSGERLIHHFFKRAPGVFEEVVFVAPTYDTTGTFAHGLDVEPELIITKNRLISDPWSVYAKPLGASVGLRLNATMAAASDANTYRVRSTPTASTFSYFSPYTGMQQSTVAYLFATKAGIQKITSFVGNGSSQTIDCGFTSGARFVCIKATSTTGDWLIGDSTRGLVAGNDPRLSLNSTAAEVTSEDWLDPASVGFVVNQVAGPNANVNGVTYFVWAIA